MVYIQESKAQAHDLVFIRTGIMCSVNKHFLNTYRVLSIRIAPVVVVV